MLRIELSRARGRARASLRRDGFTLIEVLLAVAISGVVVLASRILLEGLGNATQRVLRVARDADQESNGERVLRSLVGTIEVGVKNETFGGDERSAQFTSWCQAPRGWLERCRITLAVDMVDGVPELSTTLPDGEHVVLRRAKHTLQLRYLVDAHDGGTWFAKWGQGFLAPQAIGIVGDSVMAIIRVGERG